VLAVVEEEGLLENARVQGRRAASALEALSSPWIRQVRGMGLLLGIELTADFATQCGLPPGKAPSLYVVERLQAGGLLSIPSGTHTIRWLPPLTVSAAEVDEAVEKLAKVLAVLPRP
jgi:acetylornithine/succinyldiaminopimelate/putrescine aminotransferase